MLTIVKLKKNNQIIAKFTTQKVPKRLRLIKLSNLKMRNGISLKL